MLVDALVTIIGLLVSGVGGLMAGGIYINIAGKESAKNWVFVASVLVVAVATFGIFFW